MYFSANDMSAFHKPMVTAWANKTEQEPKYFGKKRNRCGKATKLCLCLPNGSNGGLAAIWNWMCWPWVQCVLRYYKCKIIRSAIAVNYICTIIIGKDQEWGWSLTASPQSTSYGTWRKNLRSPAKPQVLFGDENLENIFHWTDLDISWALGGAHAHPGYALAHRCIQCAAELQLETRSSWYCQSTSAQRLDINETLHKKTNEPRMYMSCLTEDAGEIEQCKKWPHSLL